MEAFDRALPAESAPYAQPGAGNVLLTVYYFGEEIGTCDNFTTITSILSAEDTRVNIHDIKKSIAYFLRQSSVDKEAIKTGPVRIDITTVSPLFMPPESVDESSYSTPGHAHHDLPGRHSHLPRSMLAVIASEKHVVEMLSNIERMNVVVGREPGALNTLENWCMQDSKCLRDDFFMAPATNSSPTSLAGTSTGWKGPKIDIILAGGNNMPVPRPRVAIAKTSTSSDMNDRPFTMYQMSVKQAGLEWNIAHRYSDFVALHTALVEQSPTDVGFIPRSRLPELPRKEIGPSNSVDESVVKKRTVGLQSFVRSLLSNPNALSNIHVLSFFGILSTSRHNHLEKV